jgi:hypothetical protein
LTLHGIELPLGDKPLACCECLNLNAVLADALKVKRACFLCLAWLHSRMTSFVRVIHSEVGRVNFGWICPVQLRPWPARQRYSAIAEAAVEALRSSFAYVA